MMRTANGDARGCGRGRAAGTLGAGFTLVELLVVIGIIAVLIGILLPTLGRARASARSLACQANLRSIGQGIMIYTTINKGYLPIGEWGGVTYDQYGRSGPADAKAQTRWNLLVQNAFNGKYGATYNDAATTNANTAKLREIFQCPDAPGTYDKAMASAGSVHYYCHPRLMPQIGSYPFGIIRSPYKIAKVRRSAEIVLVFDGALQWSTTYNIWHAKSEVPVGREIDNSGIMSAPYLLNDYTGTSKNPDDSVDMTWSPASATPNTDDGSGGAGIWSVRFRHLNNTVMNSLMADGHVQSFSYKKTLPPADKNVTDLRRRNVYVNAAPQ
jgi:prepilin-type N-terminal cleavage/methylation domain-containing protein/prepilin-type processing-associated H-X9-DG protein